MLHGFDNNVSVLKRWSSINPSEALPADWDEWKRGNVGKALEIESVDPELVSLLNGTAPAAKRVEALDGTLNTQGPTAAELAEAGRKQKLQELFDSKPLEAGTRNLTAELELAALDPGLHAQLKEKQEAVEVDQRAATAAAAQARANSMNHAMTLAKMSGRY
jgi:hypothetical protein